MATAIAVTTNWGANFIVGLGFLPLASTMGPYVFLVFSGLLFFFSAFTYKFVPETKNKGIEEITAMFRQRTYNQ
jgi:SP family facilitated glucose transporter-like MFS transporter 1